MSRGDPKGGPQERANLFERYDLDPRQGPRAITERLRELAEDAAEGPERAVIRAAWEELTMHPMRRLRAAFGAHPETRAPLGTPPPAAARPSADAPLTLGEIALRPSVARALRGAAVSPFPRGSGAGTGTATLSLEDDPILKKSR